MIGARECTRVTQLKIKFAYLKKCVPLLQNFRKQKKGVFMKNAKLNFFKSVLPTGIVLFFCLFTSCESEKHDLPLDVPQVADSTQYVDLYCGQNATSGTICFGVQKNGETWDIKSGCGPLLQNGHMDCFLFRIHDDASIYEGLLDLSMRHRISWKDSWKNEGVHITTYKSDNSALAHYLATDQDKNGMFYGANYQMVTFESIKGKLNSDDQRLLDKYVMQVDPGHVRVFVFSVDDDCLSALKTL